MTSCREPSPILRAVEYSTNSSRAASRPRPFWPANCPSPVRRSPSTLAVLERAGIGGLAANFLKLVGTNRRLFAALDMIQGYRALVAKHKGEVAAEVTLANQPSDAQLAAIKDAIAGVTKKDVQVKVKIDPSIIGGLVVKLGSRMVDSSLRTKLNAIKLAMKEAR